MLDFQARVVKELEELSEKTDKLFVFVRTETFRSLPFNERKRLLRQCAVMMEYQSILQERIDNFLPGVNYDANLTRND